MALFKAEQIESFMDAVSKGINDTDTAKAKAWEIVNRVIQNAAVSELGADFVDLDDLLETWKGSVSKRRMCIQRVHFSEHGGPFPQSFNGTNGYEIRTEDMDDNTKYNSIMRAAFIQNEGQAYISMDIVEKMLELAWMGFDLFGPKEWTRETVGYHATVADKEENNDG